MTDERREGRTRLVAGAGVTSAECAIWTFHGPVAKALLDLVDHAPTVRRLWLRPDVFDALALEQGIRPDAWPRMVFVMRYALRVERRVLQIYPCGCSRLKVAAGRCEVYGPDGRPRT